jgi:hypothetical protein
LIKETPVSHVVRIETQVRDAVAVAAACSRLGLGPPEPGTFELFSGQATGLAVRLPRWRYPVVCQLPTGELAFDNFAGAWGDRSELDRFLQRYAVEKTLLEARRQGHVAIEQPLADGAVKVVIHAGGRS